MPCSAAHLTSYVPLPQKATSRKAMGAPEGNSPKNRNVTTFKNRNMTTWHTVPFHTAQLLERLLTAHQENPKAAAFSSEVLSQCLCLKQGHRQPANNHWVTAATSNKEASSSPRSLTIQFWEVCT